MGADVDAVALGSRVVVRHRLPGPDAFGHTLSDVVGLLNGRDDSSLTVLTRRGEVRVDRDLITVVKVVPPRPARRGAAHRALSVDGMQEVMVGAWGALERQWLGRWQLRAARGYTQRANSVALLGDPGMSLTEALDRAKTWYAVRSLPLNVTLAGPVGFEAAQDPVGALLIGLGAQESERCHTMTADTASVVAALPATSVARVEVASELTDAWLGAHHGYRSSAGLSASGIADEGWVDTARAVLTGSPAQLFATVTDDGTPEGAVVAVGRAGLTPGWAGLGSVWVDPTARGQGLARAVTRALLERSLDHGARSTHLQVLSSNAPARALYEDMGFQPHHDYVNLIQAPVEWSLDERISGSIPSSSDHSTRDSGPITAQREDHA